MSGLNPPPDSWILLSLRRSRSSLRVLRALGDLEEGFPATVARLAGVRLRDVRPILEGDGVRHREELAPVRLGLVRRVETAVGPRYAITSLGRELLELVEADEDHEALRSW